jgi:hypothetical protein
VHLRYAGSGPPVVLLHDSPRSSRLHEPLLAALSDRFTVIALDTPGYGNSTPLAGDAPLRIADFADALADTLQALGLRGLPGVRLPYQFQDRAGVRLPASGSGQPGDHGRPEPARHSPRRRRSSSATWRRSCRWTTAAT